MRPTFRTAALTAAFLCVAGVMAPSAYAAQPQKLAAGEWFVHAPSKDFKDLPTLAAERDFSTEDTLGNMIFVCDRANYYLLLVTTTVKFAASEPATVTLGDGADARYQMTFKDLYGTKAALGKKFDRDADIMVAEIPKAILARLADNGALQVDLKGRSWSMALTGIAAKTATFTAFCETGKRLNRAHFAP